VPDECAKGVGLWRARRGEHAPLRATEIAASGPSLSLPAFFGIVAVGRRRLCRNEERHVTINNFTMVVACDRRLAWRYGARSQRVFHQVEATVFLGQRFSGTANDGGR
jgi:hypothetical protein